MPKREADKMKAKRILMQCLAFYTGAKKWAMPLFLY
jgi:hypothetical protein